MLVLHAHREFTLSLALRSVFADDDAAEDFDLRDIMGVVRGVGKHGILKVLFITMHEGLACASFNKGYLLLFDITGKVEVVLPLDQSSLLLDVGPHSIEMTAISPQRASRNSGLAL